MYCLCMPSLIVLVLIREILLWLCWTCNDLHSGTPNSQLHQFHSYYCIFYEFGISYIICLYHYGYQVKYFPYFGISCNSARSGSLPLPSTSSCWSFICSNGAFAGMSFYLDICSLFQVDLFIIICIKNPLSLSWLITIFYFN